MKMFGKLIWDNFEWYFENVLCKWFNILNFYLGFYILGVLKVWKLKFIFGDFIVFWEFCVVIYEYLLMSVNDDDKMDKFGSFMEMINVIDC